MKIRVLALFLVLPCGIAAVARAAESPEVASHIAAVTVYADRAQVTRIAAIDLPAGGAKIVFAKLPGWIDPESVRVALDPPAAGQIIDVAVDTQHLAEAGEEAVRKANAAVAEVADEIGAIQDEERTLTEEIARMDALRALAIDRVPREIAVGELKTKTLGDTMALISETVRRDRQQLRALVKKRRELEPVLNQRQRELADLHDRSHLQQSAVTVELRGGGRAQLRLTYLVPGATWEPVGEIRVNKGGTLVQVSQFASVVQTTGEDWAGAQLAFSTQRPDDVLDVPKAHGLMLDKSGAGLGDVVGKLAASFSQAQTVYAAENASIAKAKGNAWSESLARQAEAQNRAVESFARISERGTTAHFQALSDRSIKSDGKAVRVPIAQGEFAARPKLVAVPEVSLNAVRVADLSNGGQAAILPGKAALFVDGAFVGSSELEFAAPGESFSVFLGVHDRLKLERSLDKKMSSLKRSGKRTEMALSFLVQAENLGNEPLVVEFAERIPVAQSEQIEVSDVETPHKAKPDAQGVVRWTETIAPHSKVTLRVSYTLEYPSDFVTRAREQERYQRRPAPSPAAPSKRMLYEQIDALEHSL